MQKNRKIKNFLKISKKEMNKKEKNEKNFLKDFNNKINTFLNFLIFLKCLFTR